MQGSNTVTEWNEFKEHDIVKIANMNGLYVFMSARLDGEECLWITVAHMKTSKKSKTGTRIVTPDRVTRAPEKSQKNYNRDVS